MKRVAKMLRRFSTVLAVLAIAAAVVGANGIDAQAAAKKPTKITLKSTAKTVDIKGKGTVSVKSVKPSDASKSVSFKSSNSKVAKVSSKGVVTGVKKGTATITATSKVNKKVKATIKIAVKDLKPTSISLSKTKASLNDMPLVK